MLGLLDHMGVRVAWTGENEVTLCAGDLSPDCVEVDRPLSERIRASFLLAGPLLARFGRAVMPPPGGDVIGRRRLDPHLDAFRALGADFDFNRDIDLRAPRGLRATDVFMDEPSVMGTENALLAAARIPGTTVIGNAACEPHVQDLARMLQKMGADIQGIGSNVLTVSGPRRPPRLRAPDRPRPHRDRVVHGARGRHGRRAAHQGRHRGRPAHDPPRVRPPRAALGARRRRRPRPRRPGPRRGPRRGRAQDEGPGRPVAGVPGRPHLDRGRPRDAVHGLRPHPRVDVREPPGLHGQARPHGRRHHAVRPAPRDRQRPEPAARRAPGVPGHPRGHGDAHRGAVRRRAARRSATSARSTAATSASTSGCGTWARASSASPPNPRSRSRPRAHGPDTLVARGDPAHPIRHPGHPPGRDARAQLDRRHAQGRVRRRGLRRDRRRPRSSTRRCSRAPTSARGRRTGSSTTTARSSSCGRT